jgi:hypothetical protein
MPGIRQAAPAIPINHAAPPSDVPVLAPPDNATARIMRTSPTGIKKVESSFIGFSLNHKNGVPQNHRG